MFPHTVFYQAATRNTSPGGGTSETFIPPGISLDASVQSHTVSVASPSGQIIQVVKFSVNLWADPFKLTNGKGGNGPLKFDRFVWGSVILEITDPPLPFQRVWRALCEKIS